MLIVCSGILTRSVLCRKFASRIAAFLDFSIVRCSIIQDTQRFGNSYVFRSADERRETPTPLGPLEKANLNHLILQRKHIQFQKRCFLDFKNPEDGQGPKPSDSQRYTPSSEPYRVYLKCFPPSLSRTSAIRKIKK
jgi:hypothetical protein